MCESFAKLTIADLKFATVSQKPNQEMYRERSGGIGRDRDRSGGIGGDREGFWAKTGVKA